MSHSIYLSVCIVQRYYIQTYEYSTLSRIMYTDIHINNTIIMLQSYNVIYM